MATRKMPLNNSKISFLIVLPFILGSLSALAMAPLNWWPVLFFTLGGLYYFLQTSVIPRHALIIGFCFGLGYFGFGLYWIGNALLVEGNPYRWIWPFAIIGLPLILSPFTALSCYTINKFCNLSKPLGFIGFCLIFTIFEWLRGHLFTGFPWNLYGYTWADFNEIAQIVSLYNIYLLTLLTIFWAVTPAFLLIINTTFIKKCMIAFIITSSFIATYSYGNYKIKNETFRELPFYNFILIQPNIAQNKKWDGELISKNFMSMIQQSANSDEQIDPEVKATYIIWPETALSNGLLSAAWARTAISDMLSTYPQPAYLISGAQRYEQNKDQFFNSLVVFDKNAEIISTYNKSHLVPFGEYIPFSNIFDFTPVVGFKGFESGSGPSTINLPQEISFSPLICYEIIFPDKTINSTMERPDFIINITNDGWYGLSAGPYQHLVQAKFRAIETGLPVLRVANTGFTANIAPTGKLLNVSGLFQKVKINSKILVRGLP